MGVTFYDMMVVLLLVLAKMPDLNHRVKKS